MPALRRFGPGLIALAAFFPLLVAVGLTIHTVNVPMYDEWTWSPLVLKLHDGTLTFADLWAQQASHRSLVPTAIALALARIDGWDVRIEAACSLAIVLATQAMLAVLFVRRFGRRAGGPFLLASALLFSLAQSENWVWGFQLSWFLTDACAVAVVVLLDDDARVPHVRFVLAIVAAVAASYSLIFGFAAWIAGGCAIGRDRRAIVWWSCGAACAAVFLAGYRLPPGEHGWMTAAALGDAPQFLLAYLGSPLGCFGGRWFAELLGACGLAAFGLLLARAKGRRAPWLGLFSIALVAAILDTAGRSANGVDAATAYRYTTPASFAWIALVGLAAASDIPRRVVAAARAALVALLVFADLAGYVYGYVLIGMQRAAMAAVRDIAHADDDELSEYANDPAYLRRQVALLRANDLGPFSARARSANRNARFQTLGVTRRIASDEAER